jgi:hypothetical protein
MRSNGGPEVGLESALSLHFLQGRVSMLTTRLCPFCTKPVVYAVAVPALRQEREGTGHPLWW